MGFNPFKDSWGGATKSIKNEIKRTRPEDILSGGLTFVGREGLSKGKQEFTNAVGTLTGTRQLEKQMKKEADKQLALVAEQKAEDDEAARRRRASLRATLSERPNLFSVLGSEQGAL